MAKGDLVEDEGDAFRVSHFVGCDDHFCQLMVSLL
jgi:hypothetical protein